MKTDLRTLLQGIIRPTISPLLVCLVFMSTGCGEPTRTSFLIDPEQRLQSVEVNYPVVNLALVAPYDTVTLRAIARNALGESLPDTVPIRFTRTATQIAVSSTGLVRALAQTPPAGVAITISATWQGVTRTTTAQVVVTSVASPLQMDSFSFGRLITDTLEIGPQTGFGKPTPTVSAVAKTSTGAVIPRVIYAYRSSNPAAVVFSSFGWIGTTGPVPLVLGTQAGHTAFIIATAHVYGVTMRDSIIVKSHPEPDFASVLLFDTMTEAPAEIVLYRGGDVYWINSSANKPTGITFDHDEDVKAPSQETMGALLFWGWSQDSGNIAPFMRDTLATPGDAIPLPAHASMVRGRSFPQPGRYRWRTTRSPLIEGTIVVR